MININEKINSVYTAHSKHNFYARNIISSFVLNNNKLPLNPFTNFDYNLIYLSDELWQFGIISNGCYHEIKLAMKLNKKLKFFSLGKTINDIKEININELEFEDELKNECNIKEFINELTTYIN